MDNQATEPSGDLNVSQAADAFSSILNPPPEKEVVDGDEGAEVEAEQEAETEIVEEGTEEEEGEKITIEVDGKMVELTTKEVAEAYKNGLRQDDYTRKTMAAAEERKAAETEKSKAAQERNAYAEKLNTFAIQLQGALQEQQNINWAELLESDPVEYLKQQHLFQERQAQLGQAYSERQQIEQLNEQERAAAKQSYLQAEQQELLAKLPAWKDEKKAKAEQAEIKEFLMAEGFTAQDIAQVEDHRHVLMLRKAMMFDKLMKQAPDATKRVAQAPTKVEKPGSANEATGKSNNIMTKVRKSSSITTDQAAAAFSSFL